MEGYNPNSQSRKILITINNPNDHGMTREEVEKRLLQLAPDYACMCEEIGKEGTPHDHLFLFRDSKWRFNTLKRSFPTAHIDFCHGSCADNRDYIRKEGKWADTDKAETRVPGSFKEWGVMPDEKAEKNPKMAALLTQIDEGKTTVQIIRDNPAFLLKTKDIEATRQLLQGEDYMTQYRDVKTTYLFGPTGCGKTFSIFNSYKPQDICRITNYSKNGIRFDAYNMQKVLVFEEFHSQVPIAEMLNYLDKYPLMLPARYTDRIACYDTVFITSNLRPNEQYNNIRENAPEVWKAFLRRLDNIHEMTYDHSIVEHDRKEYI